MAYHRASRASRHYKVVAAQAAAAATAALRNNGGHSESNGDGRSSRGHYPNHDANGDDSGDDQLQFCLNGIDGLTDGRSNGYFSNRHRQSADGKPVFV